MYQGVRRVCRFYLKKKCMKANGKFEHQEFPSNKIRKKQLRWKHMKIKKGQNKTGGVRMYS